MFSAVKSAMIWIAYKWRHLKLRPYGAIQICLLILLLLFFITIIIKDFFNFRT